MASKQTYEEYKALEDARIKRISPAPLDRFERGLRKTERGVLKGTNKTFKFLGADKNLKGSQVKSGVKFVQRDINISNQRVLSSSQNMLQEVMGGSGEQLWGSGQNMPKIGEGGGIDRNDDGSTGSMFGIRRRFGFA